MTTSLQTKFLSGGFSIQRNEMVSIQQQKQTQKFQFMNSFNQTFTRLNKPAQGEFDRIDPYILSSQKRVFIGGAVTTVKRPLKQTFRNGNTPATITIATINTDGIIMAVNVNDGGLGYSPNTTFAVNVRGGEPTSGVLVPANITVRSDGVGRIVSTEILNGGNNYNTTSGSLPTVSIDEGMIEGQFFVSFFKNEKIPLADRTGVGALTGISIQSGHTGGGTAKQREGVYFCNQNSTNKITITDSSSVVVGSRMDHPVIGETTSGAARSPAVHTTDLRFQVYVDATGKVTKVLPMTFGQGFAVGDLITIPQALIGNVTGQDDLVLKVETVTNEAQTALDHGTVTWRSETFTVGDSILLEYFVDTKKNLTANNGFLRQLAEDLCLHPYANYYSTSFSTVPQRTATLTFNASPVAAGSATSATLSDPISGTSLTEATGGFQAGDVGKRIIEPNQDGTCLISAVTDGVATLDWATSNSTEEVNSFTNSSILIYPEGTWRLSIAKLPNGQNKGGFEAQPYNIIYPYENSDATLPVHIGVNGQQNHRQVKNCVDRIGDLFVVESEKATDLMSSKNDINSATSALPTSVTLTQPVKDKRKPQKWRMRFFYDQRDEYLYVNIATPLQLKDNGDITKGQGRDGIKQSVFRQPGELSEIYYNFSNDTNKAKSGWFRRQGKTTDDVEAAYPMTYRLTCTDHGTALFFYDQAAVDQDDDYAWFIVQRHANNISGGVEMEDGKSPVHCLYSPSKRPEETSDHNVGYFAEVSRNTDPTTGQTTVTSKSLNELEVYDVNGRKLKPGLPITQNIPTDTRPTSLRTTAYGSGLTYAITPTDASGANIGLPLEDTASLGTDPSTGFTIVNDVFKFPAIDAANYPTIALANLTGLPVINVAAAAPAPAIIRQGFALNFANGYGSTFVPVGDYISGLHSAIRYSSVVDTNGGPSTFSKTGYTAPADSKGLQNYNFARNQQQGPAGLGLRISRIRHRSATGTDSILIFNKDVQIVNKTEIAASVNANGDARELPIVSSVAVFTPTSAAAKQLVASRRQRVIYFTDVIANYTGAVPSITAGDATAGKLHVQTLALNAGAPTSAQSTLIPLPGSSSGGSTSGYVLESAVSGDNSFAITVAGTGILDMKVGEVLGTAGINTAASGTDIAAIQVTAIVDTFPEGDQFIYEYAWEGAGFNNEYTNFYGRTGTSSNPLFEVNRLKIFVDGSEADAAVIGQNYSIDNEGDIVYGTTSSSLEYFGIEIPMYAYSLATDTWRFNQPIENGTVVKISYENYSDVEERDTGKSTYLIRVPEDRDIPNIWNDIHKVSKGIYRFIVRESDVFKPWDFHVSAVIPQIDSPACINPVEQLSITQDKTVIFNFPTPLASQRFIYSDAEADLICIAGADSSTQGGIIKTAATKFDLDGQHQSKLKTVMLDNGGNITQTVSPSSNFVTATGAGEQLNFRREYFWHNTKKSDTTTTANDTTTNSSIRTYMGMMSTKPFGNGMRIFMLTRGGPIRPEYCDYTPRDVVAMEQNFPASPVQGAIAYLGGLKYIYDAGTATGSITLDTAVSLGNTLPSTTLTGGSAGWVSDMTPSHWSSI